MKIIDTKVFKSNWRLVHYEHTYEDGCKVHYSTTGKIADAQIVWSSKPACPVREHRKR